MNKRQLFSLISMLVYRIKTNTWSVTVRTHVCCPQGFGVTLRHDVLDVRLIVELIILQCGDGDAGHKRLFMGPLREPIQCKSSINGRKQMSRVPFQDATYLKANYELCITLSRR